MRIINGNTTEELMLYIVNNINLNTSLKVLLKLLLLVYSRFF